MSEKESEIMGKISVIIDNLIPVSLIMVIVLFIIAGGGTHDGATNDDEVLNFLDFYGINGELYSESEIDEMYSNYNYLYTDRIKVSTMVDDIMLLVDEDTKDKIQLNKYKDTDIPHILYMYDKLLPQIENIKSHSK